MLIKLTLDLIVAGYFLYLLRTTPTTPPKKGTTSK